MGNEEKRRSALEEYEIYFEGLFESEEYGNLFFEHLKNEHNTEPWLFLCKTNELAKITDFDEALKLANEIINDHIGLDAKHEINISGQKKKAFMMEIEKSVKEKDVKLLNNAFADIKHMMYHELSTDNFSRFIYTKQCQDFIRKNIGNPKFMKMKPLLSINPDDLNILKDTHVNESDFNLVKQLIHRNNLRWNLVDYSKRHINAFAMKGSDFFPGNELFKYAICSRIEMTLNFPFEHVVSTLVPFSLYKEYDKTYKGHELLAYYTSTELEQKGFYHKTNHHPISSAIVATEFDILPYWFSPISVRREIQSISAQYDPKQQELLLIGKPVNFDSLKVQIGKESKYKGYKVVDMFAYGGRSFQRLDDNRTQYVEIFFMDFGKWLRKLNAKQLVTTRAKFLDTTILEFLKKYQTKDLKELENQFGTKIDLNNLTSEQRDALRQIQQKRLKNDDVGKVVADFDYQTKS